MTLGLNLTYSKRIDSAFHDIRHIYKLSLRDVVIPMSGIQALLAHPNVRVIEKIYAMFSERYIQQKIYLIEQVVLLKKRETV